MLADKEVINNINWRVTRYGKKIGKGDLGLIWLSGKEAGIYAVAEILH